MPKSSRHKSSKHSSRDSRDYSDSEKDSVLKERSGVRVLKESSGAGSASGEKRKLDSKENKEVFISGNGDYVEEYSNNSSSKRRKDRGDDGVNDRWNGGGEDDRAVEGSTRKSKASGESKSKRREENEDQQQRSKSEGKHRESSRKESSRDVERERERKGREGKSDRFVESEDHSRGKQSAVNEKTELNADLLPSPESENQLERRVRRRRDGSGDGDKHEVDIGDNNDRRKDDFANDVRVKDEKHKDERHRDKYREDVDKDSRHRDDKQRDEHPTKDHANSRSDDKHLRDEKDAAESRQKKTKAQDSDRERERDYDHDHEHDFDSGRDRDRDRYRERDRDHDYDHDRNRDRIRDHDGDRDCRERNRDVERERDRDRRDRDRNRERERERDRERERNHDRDRDLDHDRDRDLDHDGSHLDDRSVRYKDSRGKKRSPDERDDYSDIKSRGIKGHYPDLENKSLSGSRVESDADRGRSQSRQAYLDSTISNRRRTSPSPSSHGGTDDYRHSKLEDKYRDSVTEQRSKAISSREVSVFSGGTERGSKYRSSERSNKMDDGHLGELPVERSSNSKASPMGLVERSPSSTSLDRRYINRTGIRRSLDVEETGRRGSVGPRDLSTTEDRLSRDLPLEKPLVDDSSQMDLLYYNRTSQGGSSSSLPPPPAFRAGVGSPSFMGSLEEDGRGNINARYRRSGDPNMGRGQGNAWRGPPSWSSPVPNGFIPFQHGPPHAGFQAMMPQFPNPSLFAVRPSMEINHSGIPYHIPDADRFSSHMRPLGWQNMMDGSGPSHLHGWDGNNGAFRDEPHMYGGSDWDQNRHMMNGRGWETSSDMWKGENGDANMDLPSMAQKEDLPLQAPSDDSLAGKVGQQSALYENNHGGSAKSDEPRSISSPAKGSSKLPAKTAHEKTSDPSKRSTDDDVAHRRRVYLSKLDISADLAGEELYSQCMSLLGTYQTVTLETDATVIVNLKDGGRAVPKSSKSLLTPPFFPAANDSVFQRAMNNYKKQSIQMFGIVNGGKIDMISKPNEGKVEQGSLCNMDKTEGLVLIKDTEISHAPKSTPEHEKPEAVPYDDFHEVSKEKVSSPCLVVQDDTHTPPLNVEVHNQDYPPKSPEEPVPVFNGDEMDVETSEQVIMGCADGHHSPTLDNAQDAATILPADDDKMDDETSKNKSEDSVYPPEERHDLGDAINGPLCLSDGSPKISEAMMPGSNESESVILNRIHHSPESTH